MNSMTNKNDKTRRVTVDLSAQMTTELDGVVSVTGMKTAEVFRNSLVLMGAYVKCQQDGKQFRIVGPSDVSTVILLPVICKGI